MWVQLRPATYIRDSYDTAARLTKLTDWLSDDYGGNPGLRYGYDAAGRLTTLTDYDDEVLTYVYDASGNVLTMTDYHSNSTTYTYTDRNQVSTITAPGTRVWDFDYNALGQNTQYSHPNGMTTAYAYDTRNRMTKIEHKDGATVLDSYLYALEDNGNITKTTQVDGSYWDYYYDNRYRLTKAERFNSGATIKAKYEYTYNLADNMLTKVEPFLEDFNDANYTGWSVWGGSWTAANTMAENTGTAGSTLAKTTTDGNVEMTLRYRSGDTSNSLYWGYVWIRYADHTNRIRLSFEPGKVVLLEQYLGAYTTLDQDTSFTTAQDTWYNYRIVADGAHIEVWRNEDGQMPVKVLETNSSQMTTTASIGFATTANSTSDFDDIRILSDSLASTTTMTYTNANEISTLTDPNGTQTFGFDDWGRMTSKSRGSFSATYGYAYGDKLIDVASNFPGETNVSYTIGGNSRQRSRDDGTITKFRYEYGHNVLQEESASSDLLKTVIRKTDDTDGGSPLANVSGPNPASGTPLYYLTDLIGTTRMLASQSKTPTGKIDYEPFGTISASLGDVATFGFAASRRDSTVGIDFAPFRDYAPQQARWLTRDPFNIIDGPNVYQFVGSNPISNVDPDGRAYAKCRLLSAICTSWKWDVDLVSTGVDVYSICVQRKCIWRCYHLDLGGTDTCYEVPCPKRDCPKDHGVEELRSYGPDKTKPRGAAPTCREKTTDIKKGDEK